jgi:NAD+ synthetase
MKSLTDVLKSYRDRRSFDAQSYISAKVTAINRFMSDNGLDSLVLGVSGGVDSALVLFLLREASKSEGSPIRRVQPLSLPIYRVDGVTTQGRSASMAEMAVVSAGYDYVEVPLQDAYNSIVASSMGCVTNRKWAEGQMASILRTPVLYYHAAILQASGYRSIVCGTTNRDEGSYIGFFGKASDAMVDLQPIADLHKSEVYSVARLLGVPEDIVNATPRGDVWDYQVDEEMIGAPYHILELYLLSKEYGNDQLTGLSGSDRRYYDTCVENIERIHASNKHKYKVGNPAHFIDVVERKIPGGWT